jgi:hypothetical protein
LCNYQQLNAKSRTNSTIADLAFITWDLKIPSIFEANEIDIAKDYPHYLAWHKRVLERPAVKKTIADKDVAMAEFMAKMAANGPPKHQPVVNDKANQVTVVAVEAVQN